MSLAEYAWRRRDQRDETDEDEVVRCQLSTARPAVGENWGRTIYSRGACWGYRETANK